MQAKMRQQGEITIINIQGPLEIEKAQHFRDVCCGQCLGEKVIFNMEKTSFVGSTGINSFVEALRVVSSKTHHNLRLVGVKSEFKRIFCNMGLEQIEIHETETGAIESF